jgi:glutamine synthetase
MIILEYIWIDGYNTTRSKTRCLDLVVDLDIDLGINLKDVPYWNYDGSSTGQAETRNSEIELRPVALYPSCFEGIHCLVLCETWTEHGPHESNTRQRFLSHNRIGSRFGFEQEFFLNTPSPVSLDTVQKDFYCGVGAPIGRLVIMKALSRCLKSGLHITGMNAEVAPGQWELQIDDIGVKACDGLWILRYILTRTAEEMECSINLHPKPVPTWNGSGCHANFSTPEMRTENGLPEIMRVIDNLSQTHSIDIMEYGADNCLRLSGKHETSSMDTFTYGVGDRGASIRIPKETFKNGCGYLEDRRPASNMDPYVIASILNRSI